MPKPTHQLARLAIVEGRPKIESLYTSKIEPRSKVSYHLIYNPNKPTSDYMIKTVDSIPFRDSSEEYKTFFLLYRLSNPITLLDTIKLPYDHKSLNYAFLNDQFLTITYTETSSELEAVASWGNDSIGFVSFQSPPKRQYLYFSVFDRSYDWMRSYILPSGSTTDFQSTFQSNPEGDYLLYTGRFDSIYYVLDLNSSQVGLIENCLKTFRSELPHSHLQNYRYLPKADRLVILHSYNQRLVREELEVE